MASCSNFWMTVIAVTSIKFLFIPSYRSTDFEVHRNWLAITHNLPISKWYYENTSKWTLDYPPLFAWFECLLSYIAHYFDPLMLMVSNLEYSSINTIIFQRLSVIVSDLMYIYAVKQFSDIMAEKKHKQNDPWIEHGMIIAMLLLWNPGLLIVDHIHFQYNGFLTGILLLSMARIIQEQYLGAAFWYVVLLNMKHIYLCLAPVYFMYLLRHYCFHQSSKDGKSKLSDFSIINFMKLSLVVLSVFAISFGPFIYMKQLPQVLTRLFPFGRGLTHAYWAPNFWALYNCIDKGLTMAALSLHLNIRTTSQPGSMTGGLVHQYEHQILPSISPGVTLIMAVASILPVLHTIWKSPKNPWIFIRSLVLCAFGGFLFGWHVHEKSILMVIIPLTILALVHRSDAENYLFLATVGHFSIFPLLFNEQETPIKILLLLLHSVYGFTALGRIYRQCKTDGYFPPLGVKESIFLLGLIPLQLYYSFGNRLFGFEQHLPFLPLLLISSYCATGIFYTWSKMYREFLHSSTNRLLAVDGNKLKIS